MHAVLARLSRPTLLMGLAAILMTLLALVMDLVRVSGLSIPVTIATPLELTLWSEQLRFWRTVACAVVSLPCLGAVRDRMDAGLLVLACMSCVPADYFLILARDLATGIGVFFAVQILFIVRHARSLRWRDLAAKRHAAAAVLAVALHVLGNLVLYPLLSPKGLALPVMAYSAVLLLACLSAWWLTSDPRYPTVNARLAFAGMVLFVLCDITVGAGAALTPSAAGDLVRAFTGVFYTPCLLLLAISARSFPAGPR